MLRKKKARMKMIENKQEDAANTLIDWLMDDPTRCAGYRDEYLEALNRLRTAVTEDESEDCDENH